MTLLQSTPTATLTPTATRPGPARRAPVTPASPVGTRRIPRPRLDAVLLLVLAAVAALTRGWHLGAQGFSDDEGTYTAQAWAVIHEQSLSHYTYWYDHPPLGWILLAGWQAVSAPFTHPGNAVVGARELMVVLAAVNVALLFVAARRLHLGRVASVGACLLWIASPLALDYSRMAFLDGIALPMLLGAFVLALTPRRHLWAFAGCGLLLATAVLTKETMLLSLPAVLAVAWRTSAGRTRPFCLTALGGSLALLTVFYPLMALLKNELTPGPDHVSLFAAIRFQLYGRPSGGSPLAPGSASNHQLMAWLHLDPVLLIGGIAAAAALLVLRRARGVAVAVLLPVATALRPGYLPDPFIIAVLPFCALALAATIESLLRKVTAGAGRPTQAGLLAGSAVVAVAAAVLLSWVAPTNSLNAGTASSTLTATTDWVAANVPHDSRVLVDDTEFVDLAQAGFDRHTGVIWFYKTDFSNNLDPSVARTLPDGYRNLQYVIAGPILRSALDQYPEGLADARHALQYSKVVATFGAGPSRIEVRRIDVPPGAPDSHPVLPTGTQ